MDHFDHKPSTPFPYLERFFSKVWKAASPVDKGGSIRSIRSTPFSPPAHPRAHTCRRLIARARARAPGNLTPGRYGRYGRGNTGGPSRHPYLCHTLERYGTCDKENA